MKTSKLIITVLIIFILGGISSRPARGNTGTLIKEKEDVKIARQTRNVSTFTGIELGGAFELFLKQGSTQEVVVEADEEIIDYITTEVSGNVLKIGLKKEQKHCYKNIKEMNIYITMATLKSLNISGAVELTFENQITTDDLAIDISGAVEADINLVAKTVNMELSGASEIDIKGSAGTVEIKASGASEVDAFDFSVENLSIYGSGAIDANVLATGTLKASASGACSIRYKGNPRVDVHSSGASSFKKAD